MEMHDPTPLRGAVVLETDVNGLGVIRSLAALRPKSPRIIGVDFCRSVGFKTRLCRMSFAPPPTDGDGRSLCNHLVQLAQAVGGPLALFPCGDRTVRLVCRYREQLAAYYRFLLDDPDRIESLIDKERFAQLAASVGTLTPATAVIPAAVGTAANCGLRFPLVAKPTNSPGDDPVKRAFKAKLFQSADEWDLFFSKWTAGGRVLVQEQVIGEDQDIYFYGGAWRAGRALCGFTGRKIRQHPRGFGSTVMAACERRDDVFEAAEQFLARIGFTGLCDVEFKRDARDGKLYLIEVNPRQGQWHRIGRACGIDLLQAAYLDLAGIRREWPSQPAGCSGYWSYQFQDVARLVDDWRNGKRGLGGWVRPYFSLPQDGVFNWRDPRPWASEFANLVRSRLRPGRSESPRPIDSPAVTT